MTIIIGMTLGIMDGMAMARIGMDVRTGMPDGGTTRGMILGSMVGIVRGDGIIHGIGRFLITVHITVLRAQATTEGHIVTEVSEAVISKDIVEQITA